MDLKGLIRIFTKNKKALMVVKNDRAVLEYNTPIPKSVLFVYNNPDVKPEQYLRNLKDVDVGNRLDRETLIFNQKTDKWESGPAGNVTVDVNFNVDAGKY